MTFVRSSLFPLCCLFLLNCGQPTQTEPPHFLYEQNAQSLDNPFPDLRLVTDGQMQVRPDWFRPFMMKKALTPRMLSFLERYAEDARGIDAVGNFGPTLLLFSEEIEMKTLEKAVTRLRKTSAGYEVLEENVTVEHSRDSFSADGKIPDDYPSFILVRPSVPLPEGEEGLLVIRRGPKTTAGTELGRGHSFDKDPASKELSAAAASALGIAEQDVLLALPLRAQLVKTPMRQVANWVNQNPAPSYTIPPKGISPDTDAALGTWSYTDADWPTIQAWLNKHSFANPASDVGKVIIGTFQSRDLRGPNGSWTQSLIQNPAAAPQPDVTFVLTLPKIARPADGYRLVVGAHGLGGRNTLRVGSGGGFCAEVAQMLAKSGLGCIGIDTVKHGERGSSSDFFSIENLPGTREHFRQTYLDLLQLAKVARTLDVDGDGVSDVHPELGFLGNSLGAILGAAVVSYAPDIRTAVLNVGGAELANILVSRDIQLKVGLLLVKETGLLIDSPEYFASFPLFRTVGQLVLESADPMNLTDKLTDKGVLLQLGLNDITIPHFTTEHLAQAMGLTEFQTGTSGDQPLQALHRIDPARYLSAEKMVGYSGHNVMWDIAPVRTQVTKFLEQRGTQLVVE